MIHCDLNLPYYTLNTIHHHDETKAHCLSYEKRNKKFSDSFVCIITDHNFYVITFRMHQLFFITNF